MAPCEHSSRYVAELDSKTSACISQLYCRIIYLDGCPIGSHAMSERAAEIGFHLTEGCKMKINLGCKMYRPRQRCYDLKYSLAVME
jgi:hypothetical protein